MVASHDARDRRRRQGGQIRSIRKYRGLRPIEVADALGVCESAVRHWENGTHSPRPEQQLELAKMLGVPHSVIFSLDAEMVA